MLCDFTTCTTTERTKTTKTPKHTTKQHLFILLHTTFLLNLLLFVVQVHRAEGQRFIPPTTNGVICETGQRYVYDSTTQPPNNLGCIQLPTCSVKNIGLPTSTMCGCTASNNVFPQLSQQILQKVDSGCTPTKQCGICQGNCEEANDCLNNMLCFQRDSSNALVPGCASGGDGDITSYGYCYEPTDQSAWVVNVCQVGLFCSRHGECLENPTVEFTVAVADENSIQINFPKNDTAHLENAKAEFRWQTSGVIGQIQTMKFQHCLPYTLSSNSPTTSNNVTSESISLPMLEVDTTWQNAQLLLRGKVNLLNLKSNDRTPINHVQVMCAYSETSSKVSYPSRFVVVVEFWLFSHLTFLLFFFSTPTDKQTR